MPYLKKAVLAENLSDGTFIQRYRFTREDGSEGIIETKPAEADKWAAFRDLLRNKNAHSSLLSKATIERAAASKPEKEVAYADSSGWRPGRKTFVLPDRVIGTNTKKICGLLPVTNRSRPKPKGTAKKWLQSVGPLAAKSSGMMLTTSCSFAAPLLRIVNEQSFGLCLAGKTGGGKTTATLVASSTLTTGQIDQLPSWNATLAGLEPVLRSHNDCLMIVDDLNKMPTTSDREKYRSAHNFAHNLGTGSIKLRSSVFDESSENGRQYRVISLTSAETTIAELAAKYGERRGGDARRLVDVPIYFDGLDHIFDRIPKASELGQSELQALYRSVHTACAKNNGHIFAQYVRFLIKSRTTLPDKIRTNIKRFLDSMPSGGNSILHADIIRKFGLIYAGGALAIEGVELPWSRSDLLQAIVKCCKAALDTISSEQHILDDGWEKLKNRLMALPRLSTIPQGRWSQIDGYVEPQRGRYRCVLKTDKFNRTFANALQRTLVMDKLTRRGWITRSRSQENQGQFIWPDHVRRRSLEINWRKKANR